MKIFISLAEEGSLFFTELINIYKPHESSIDTERVGF